MQASTRWRQPCGARSAGAGTFASGIVLLLKEGFGVGLFTIPSNDRARRNRGRHVVVGEELKRPAAALLQCVGFVAIVEIDQPRVAIDRRVHSRITASVLIDLRAITQGTYFLRDDIGIYLIGIR